MLLAARLGRDCGAVQKAGPGTCTTALLPPHPHPHPHPTSHLFPPALTHPHIHICPPPTSRHPPSTPHPPTQAHSPSLDSSSHAQLPHPTPPPRPPNHPPSRWEHVHKRDEHGAIFLDYDPQLLAPILSWLRHHGIAGPGAPLQPPVPPGSELAFATLLDFLGLARFIPCWWVGGRAAGAAASTWALRRTWCLLLLSSRDNGQPGAGGRRRPAARPQHAALHVSPPTPSPGPAAKLGAFRLHPAPSPPHPTPPRPALLQLPGHPGRSSGRAGAAGGSAGCGRGAAARRQQRRVRLGPQQQRPPGRPRGLVAAGQAGAAQLAGRLAARLAAPLAACAGAAAAAGRGPGVARLSARSQRRPAAPYPLRPYSPGTHLSLRCCSCPGRRGPRPTDRRTRPPGALLCGVGAGEPGGRQPSRGRAQQLTDVCGRDQQGGAGAGRGRRGGPGAQLAAHLLRLVEPAGQQRAGGAAWTAQAALGSCCSPTEPLPLHAARSAAA
jgi:hypothetical protein